MTDEPRDPDAVATRTMRWRFATPGWLITILDIIASLVAAIAALAIRFDTTDLTTAVAPYLPAVLLPVLIRPLVLAALGLHRREWRYASVRDMVDLVRAVIIGSAIIAAVFVVMSAVDAPGTNPFPRSFFLLEPVLFLALTASIRIVARSTLERSAGRETKHAEVRTLVYGAGNAGSIVARMATPAGLRGMRIVGFVDDDRRKHGSRLLGHRVYGGLDDLESAVARSGAEQLLIAIPSAAARPVRRAVEAARDLGLTVKIVPPLRDMVTGHFQVTGIRSVNVEDLLRRAPITIDYEAVAGSINGASVVVTGGGGSVGSELVRQILSLGPRVLTVVEHNEWALWSVERDIAAMRREADGVHVVAALADVRSMHALTAVLHTARPDVVFHAAALKHVPYVESYPSEGVLTNVLGTRNVLRACEDMGIARFTLISTDKAVEPVSVMGATKRLAEQLTVAAGHRTQRAYAAVRFGNVLGSSGSVVPLLQRQLDDGLPLTITNPDATRYFMTIAEAVSLILEAAADPSPGDVHVLDMGEPVKIMDLARDLIRLNGMNIDDVPINVTGLRPGERLHEKLFYDDEVAERTRHPGILRAARSSSAAIEAQIEAFVDEVVVAATAHDDAAVRALLRRSAALTGMTSEAALSTFGAIAAAEAQALIAGAPHGRPNA
ncbi:MAG: polysaccharide biosynthesis protein [Candidatus Limnocylindria bacterium]